MRPILFHKKYNNTHGVLLAEFRFYNKANEVINDTILTDIQTQLETHPNNTLYWTNEFYAKNRIGFRFYSVIKEESKTKNRTDVYIDLMKLNVDFSVEQFNTAEYIFDNYFITCHLTPEQYNAIIDINFFHNNKMTETLIIINTFNEIIDWAIENTTLQTEHLQQFNEMNTLCKTLFNHTITEISTKVIKDNYSEGYVYFIMDVIEKRIHNKNYRISIEMSFRRFYSPEFRLKIYKEENIEYNNIDKERIYFHIHNKNYFLDLALTFYNTDKQLQLNLDVLYEIGKDIRRVLDEEQNIITPFIYNFYAQRKERQNRSYARDKKEQLINTINEQYKKLLKQSTTIKIRETLISKKRIEVEGRFYMEFNEEFFDVYDRFYIIKKILDDNEARYNFNTLYEEILKNSKLEVVNRNYTRNNEYKNITNLTYIVNKMKITIHKEGDRMHINGIFSRIDDVYHLLSKAICYTDITAFNNYIEEVSHIGVDWKQLINTGIIITLDNPFYSTLKAIGQPTLERTMMRFSLLWDVQKRSNVYLLLNGHKYLIRYKSKFLKNFNLPNRRITITTLALELKESLVDITDNDILDIIKHAMEEAKIVQQRGEELVTNTIKETKALLTKENIQNNMVEGYLIVGLQTKAEYFINKIDLTVYKKTNGQWNRRCVVDDSRKQRIFEDRLANRLVNIFNEPSYIGTLHNS
jgi:hypothetical protein